MIRRAWLVSCCVLALNTAAATAGEVHQRIAPDEVPKLIAEIAKKLAGADAAIIAAERVTEVEEEEVQNVYILTTKSKKGTVSKVEVYLTDKAGIRGAELSQVMAPGDLPGDVTNVVKRMCAGEIVSVERYAELEAGQRVGFVGYSVHVKRKDGPVVEVRLEMAGAVVEGAVAEEPLAFTDLPKAVLASAKAARPNAKLLCAARRTTLDDDDLSVVYSIPIRQKDGQRLVIVIATRDDGAVRRVDVRELDDDEEGEEDDDDDDDDDDD